jgi:hypothetical protein
MTSCDSELDIKGKVMKDLEETACGKNIGQSQSLYRNRLGANFTTTTASTTTTTIIAIIINNNNKQEQHL